MKWLSPPIKANATNKIHSCEVKAVMRKPETMSRGAATPTPRTPNRPMMGPYIMPETQQISQHGIIIDANPYTIGDVHVHR